MEQSNPPALVRLSEGLGLVERLRRHCTDWDVSTLGDPEPPMDGLTCEEVREAADEIDRLRWALLQIANGAPGPRHVAKAALEA